MAELIVLMGPPASGKTTYAATLSGPLRHVVSVDDVRARGGLAPGARNHAAFVAAYRIAERALGAGQSVVFDSTAITPNVRHQLRRLAKRRGLAVHLVVVHSGSDICRDRNGRRARPVPEGPLEAMLADYERQYPIAVGHEKWSSVRIVSGEDGSHA